MQGQARIGIGQSRRGTAGTLELWCLARTAPAGQGRHYGTAGKGGEMRGWTRRVRARRGGHYGMAVQCVVVRGEDGSGLALKGMAGTLERQVGAGKRSSWRGPAWRGRHSGKAMRVDERRGLAGTSAW